MNRFFVEPQQVKDKQIVINNSDDIRHITKVLRLEPGEIIQVCDGVAWEYEARLISLDKAQVIVEICDQQELHSEPPIEVVLLQGIPKGEKFDFVIQKSTEMGIKEIIPIQAKRSVVRIDKQKADTKVERWQRIAYEAAKQCQRGQIPRVSEPMTLAQVLKGVNPEDIILVPWEEEQTTPLGTLFGKPRPQGRVFIVIGPEGGLDQSEIEELKQAGGITVTLGPRILRTETAALAATSLVMYAWGDLGGVGK